MRKLATGTTVKITTLMLQNLPAETTEWDVATELLNIVPGGEFDFVFAPVAPDGSGSVGYAIVNFASTAAARVAYTRVAGWLWSRGVSGPRLIDAKIAHVQGLAQNLRRLSNGQAWTQHFRPPLVFEGGKFLAFEDAVAKYCTATAPSIVPSPPSQPPVEQARTRLFQADALRCEDFFEDVFDHEDQDVQSDVSTTSGSALHTPAVVVLRVSV